MRGASGRETSFVCFAITTWLIVLFKREISDNSLNLVLTMEQETFHCNPFYTVLFYEPNDCITYLKNKI